MPTCSSKPPYWLEDVVQAEEKETVVRIGYGPGAEASVWSTQRAIWAKCRKAGWKLAESSTNQRGTVVGQEWTAPADCFRISMRKPGRQKVKTGFALRKKAYWKGTEKRPPSCPCDHKLANHSVGGCIACDCQGYGVGEAE
jgi:hypothetical protein